MNPNVEPDVEITKYDSGLRHHEIKLNGRGYSFYSDQWWDDPWDMFQRTMTPVKCHLIRSRLNDLQRKYGL